MERLFENWRLYERVLREEQQAIDLVEEIWRGDYTASLLILEGQQELLDESVRQFFQDAFNSVRGKISQFSTFKENQLIKFVDAGIAKIQDFFTQMREIARTTRNEILLKLFPKRGTRSITDKFGVLRRPEYLAAGAAVMSTILAKLAELGAQAVLNALSGGLGGAAQVAQFVQTNIERLKLIVETIKNALDPMGIMDLLDTVESFKDKVEFLQKLKDDLQDPYKEFHASFQGAPT